MRSGIFKVLVVINWLAACALYVASSYYLRSGGLLGVDGMGKVFADWKAESCRPQWDSRFFPLVEREGRWMAPSADDYMRNSTQWTDYATKQEGLADFLSDRLKGEQARAHRARLLFNGAFAIVLVNALLGFLLLFSAENRPRADPPGRQGCPQSGPSASNGEHGPSTS